MKHPFPRFKHPIAILTGTTASGKTSSALEFCSNHPEIEIVNADSVLIYQGLNIGSAKPTPEEQKQVKHHLIDQCTPDHLYTAAQFIEDILPILIDIEKRKKRALIVGGTGFYLKALLFGMWEQVNASPELRNHLESLDAKVLYEKLKQVDPVAADKIGPTDHYRLVRANEVFETSGKTPTEHQSAQNTTPHPDFTLLILDRPQDELLKRVQKRAQLMIENGWIEEVESLIKQYPNSRALHSVGYAQIIQFLEGKPPSGRKLKPGIQGVIDEVVIATRQLIKAQRTWFRGQFDGQWIILDEEKQLLIDSLEKIYPSGVQV